MLDKMTQEVARMAIAEVLRVTRGIEDTVKMVIDGVQSVLN